MVGGKWSPKSDGDHDEIEPFSRIVFQPWCACSCVWVVGVCCCGDGRAASAFRCLTPQQFGAATGSYAANRSTLSRSARVKPWLRFRLSAAHFEVLLHVEFGGQGSFHKAQTQPCVINLCRGLGLQQQFGAHSNGQGRAHISQHEHSHCSV